MMTETKTCMTDREWIHKLVEVIDDEYLDDVKWMIQVFAAKSLNKKLKDNTQHQKR